MRQTKSLRGGKDSTNGEDVIGLVDSPPRWADTVRIHQRLYPESKLSLALSKHCSDAYFVCDLGLEQRNL